MGESDRARGGDVWGGLAAMLVAVPSSIAFGLVVYSPLGAAHAAAGALAGILGAIALGIVAPLLGGTPRLISAPCAPAAAVMAALAAELAGPDSPLERGMRGDTALLLLTLVTALAGALQIAFSAIGGGTLIKYIPYPVVAGYLSSVAVLIVVSQAPRLVGLPRGVALTTGLASPGLWQWPSVVVGAVTIALTLAAPKMTRAVPAAILGLVGGVAAYFGLAAVLPALRSLDGNTLVIGSIGSAADVRIDAIADRWAAISRLEVSHVRAIVIPALTLAVLLSIDTLKSCIAVDALTGSRHRSNPELRGQGFGNLASAILGGVPGAGQMGATLVNISSGGKSRLSSVLEGVFAAAAFLLLGRVVAWVPIAALAGVLTVVAYRMVDVDVLHLLRHRSTRLDFAVVAVVVVTAVAVDLFTAAGVGLGLAILLFLRQQIRESVVRRKTLGSHTFSRKQRLAEELAVLEKKGERTTICELQGSLFFGTTDQLFTKLETDLQTQRFVILDLRRVQSIDFTAAHMLVQMQTRLAKRDAYLFFSTLPPDMPTRQDLESYFDQIGLETSSGNVRVFDELDGALEWAEEQWLAEDRAHRAAEAPLGLTDIDLVKGVDAETLEALTRCVTERSVAADQTIFAQGDVGDDVFLIRRGAVKIMLPLAGARRHHLTTFGRGDFFGDMAFLDHAARSADAVAATATDLYVLSRDRFESVAKDHPDAARKFMTRLAGVLAARLRHTDAQLRVLEDC